MPACIRRQLSWRCSARSGILQSSAVLNSRARQQLAQQWQIHRDASQGLTQVHRGASATLIQRAPRTDKERFMASTFALKAFVPSTRVGNFDVEYKPKTGAMRVIINLHFDFTNADANWKGQAANPADEKWKSAQKKQWVNEFKTQILSVWGNINQINCVKPGWEDIVASPQITIKERSRRARRTSVSRSTRRSRRRPARCARARAAPASAARGVKSKPPSRSKTTKTRSMIRR